MKVPKIGFRAFQLVVALSFVIAQLALLAPGNVVEARGQLYAISLTSKYTQNFDTPPNALPSTGTTNTWTDDSTIPGWYVLRSTSTSNALLVSSGGSNTGGLYSYGSNNVNERALGALASGGTGTIYYGVKLVNDSTTQSVYELKVTYTGEQWRDGGAVTPVSQKNTFDYSLTATSIYNSGEAGRWTPFTALDFVSPTYTYTSSTGVALDGNTAANRTLLTASIPVYIPAGGMVWLRWTDINNANNDHGLAVDDVSVEAVMGPPAVTVQSTSPTAGADGVAVDAPIDVTFSDSVTISDGYTLSCNGQPVALAPSGSGTAYTFTPASPLPLAASCTFTLPAASVKDAASHPMAGDFTLTFNTVGCGAPFTPIHDIQGSGSASPLVDTPVTVEGVVTADFQTYQEMSGLFLQAAPGEEDADPTTSEGVFVYLWDTTNNFNVGDRIRLTGKVVEFTSSGKSYGQFAAMTEISSPFTGVEKCASGADLPEPINVFLPDDSNPVLGLEQFEGMRVRITDSQGGPLTVQQNYFQGRFGQLTLATGGRVFQQNNGTGGSADDIRRMVILDDHSHASNAASIPYYAADGAVRAGDTVSNLVGVLDQGRINGEIDLAPATLVFPNVYYRLQPTVDPEFTRINPRPEVPPDVLGQNGTTTIASFNVLNYFLTLDYGNKLNTARGADTPEELQRQQDKLVTALSAIHADVFGLMEIESDDTQNAPSALAAALNAKINQPSAYSYQYVADPSTGTGGDVIQTAILYNTVTVTPVGASMSDPSTVFDRSPFAQAFLDKATQEKFIVVVNHFKSKGSCPVDGEPDFQGNFDTGDGQGCWVAKRVAQAEQLLTFIETLKQTDPDVIVIGDLNSYGNEDPIQTLTSGGLVNQVEANVPEEERYSYVFDGAAGYLDHALSTSSVTKQLTGVAYWHINADEPNIIDYNQEFKSPPETNGSPDLFNSSIPYRASDHDPVLVGLHLNTGPSLASAIADQSAIEGWPFSFTLLAGAFTDPNPNDTLFLSASLPDGSLLPDWLVFDGEGFSGTPGTADVGTLSILVTAADMSGETAEDTFTLTVMPNQAPVFNPVEGQPLPVDEGQTITFTLSATDDDLPAGKLTYSPENAPANATFNPNTGEFSWTPTEAQAAAPFTPYALTFTVSDGIKTGSITININVNEVNNAPVFTDPGTQETNELKPYTLTLVAQDDNTALDLLSFKQVSGPTGSSFDETSHTLTWTPTEAQGAGDYQAAFTVSDGEFTSKLTVNFHVNEINADPVLNTINDEKINEGAAWTLTPAFSDPDLPANTLIFRLGDGAPVGMKLNTATGVMTWTPDETQARAEGYPITLYLSDGKKEVSQAFTLTVDEVNSDPYFTQLADKTVGPFGTLTFDVTAADGDLPRQNLTIAVKQGTLPTGANFVFDKGKGMFTWKPGLHAAGKYTITFTVTDGVVQKPVEKVITIIVAEPVKVFLPALVHQP